MNANYIIPGVVDINGDFIGPTPERIKYNVGVGLTMYGVWGINLSLNYDYTWSKYTKEHAGSLKARLRF
ncbi:hypothetical protein [Piscirickettsia litoralis]|uniref:Autotransporter domain-containing protein n=1 Tax=Piscirickettsia litoralis TaxID=1891921 RepID=A0ABX3A050_9GAMM|nr:hypothetical protein [Piscirickettsia litoralis]ODN41994.1 hypothetical protein BGC07_02255 [Piscirickettsia litoralis]